jgi:hypothetical protein
MNAITEATAGVATFNGRTGAVELETADVTAVGAALLASPAFTGAPSGPTQAPGTANTTLATTAFVMAALSGVEGVASFNTRTGAVTLTTADITAAGGAPLASPVFTGTPAAPTASPGASTTQLATTAFVAAAVAAAGGVTTFNGRAGAITLTSADVSAAGGAPLASPPFTGTPTAPTAATGTNTNQLATTAFVLAELATGGGVDSFNGRAGAVTLTPADVLATGALAAYLPLAGGTMTGALTPASVPGIVGTTTNDNAAEGSVGEYIRGDRAPASAVGVAANTVISVWSITLTAGDWDVTATVGATTTSSITSLVGGLSTVAATFQLDYLARSQIVAPNLGSFSQVSFGPARFSLSAASTVLYLVGLSNFTAGTTALFGSLSARRVR